MLAVLGTGVTIVDFAAVTLLQRAIPDNVLARVFSLLQSVFVGTIGLGALLAPLLVSWLGIRGALVASGVVLPLLAAVLWRRLATLDAGYVVTDEAVDLLPGGADLRPARPARSVRPRAGARAFAARSSTQARRSCARATRETGTT